MSRRVTLRIPSGIYEKAEEILAEHQKEMALGRVTMTDVFLNLLQRGIDAWVQEQIQEACDHEDSHTVMDGDVRAFHYCERCGLVSKLGV